MRADQQAANTRKPRSGRINPDHQNKLFSNSCIINEQHLLALTNKRIQHKEINIMANHQNRKAVSLDDLKGFLYPISSNFKKNILTNQRFTDGYEVTVVVDWDEGRVFLTNKHGRGQALDRDQLEVSLAGLGDNIDQALDLARLVDAYLIKIEANKFLIDEAERSPVENVLFPCQGMSREDFSPQEIDAAEAEARRIGREAMKATLAD